MVSPAISAKLDEPFTVGAISAICQSREEFFDVFDLTVKDAKLNLRDVKFADTKGLQLESAVAKIHIVELFSSNKPDAKDERIQASLYLQSSRIVAAGAFGAGGAVLSEVQLNVSGHPDKLQGDGKATLAFLAGSAEDSCESSGDREEVSM